VTVHHTSTSNASKPIGNNNNQPLKGQKLGKSESTHKEEHHFDTRRQESNQSKPRKNTTSKKKQSKIRAKPRPSPPYRAPRINSPPNPIQPSPPPSLSPHEQRVAHMHNILPPIQNMNSDQVEPAATNLTSEERNRSAE